MPSRVQLNFVFTGEGRLNRAARLKTLRYVGFFTVLRFVDALGEGERMFLLPEIGIERFADAENCTRGVL